MSGELIDYIPPRVIAEITKTRVEETRGTPEHIIASDFLHKASLTLEDLIRVYSDMGTPINPEKNVALQLRNRANATAFGLAKGMGMLGISVMATESARRNGIITQEDINTPFNSVFNGIFPVRSRPFVYELTRREIEQLEDLVKKRDRTYGRLFTHEKKIIPEPVRTFIEDYDALREIKLVLPTYQTRVVNLVKMRAIEMENDLMPRDH